MDKNPFLKRLMKDKMEDVAHSSVYAKAQNAKGLGATSTQSFAARQKIEHHRQNVGVYNESEIVTGMGGREMKAVTINARREVGQKMATRERYAGGQNRQMGGGVGLRNQAAAKPRSAPPARRNPGISW